MQLLLGLFPLCWKTLSPSPHPAGEGTPSPSPCRGLKFHLQATNDCFLQRCLLPLLLYFQGHTGTRAPTTFTRKGEAPLVQRRAWRPWDWLPSTSAPWPTTAGIHFPSFLPSQPSPHLPHPHTHLRLTAHSKPQRLR